MAKNKQQFSKFRLGDMFNIHPTKSYGLTNSKLFAHSGKVPVVANSSLNNGIGGYTNLKPTEKGNMITFSDTVTSDGIFYQPSPFIGYSHVQGLYPYENIEPHLNKNTCLYIVSAFKKATRGLYDYGLKFTRDNASNTFIVLPSLNNGYIDWEKMNQDIKEIIRVVSSRADTEINSRYNLLNNSGINSIKDFDIKQASFSDFSISDLFPEENDIRRGKRLVKSKRKKGPIPFVTAGVTNHGISSYISEENNVPFSDDLSISVDMFGWADAKNYKYGFDDHVVSLSHEGYTIEQLIFISAAINKVTFNTMLFSWEYMVTKKRISEIKIKLPVDQGGRIDWQLVKSYIKYLLGREVTSISMPLRKD